MQIPHLATSPSYPRSILHAESTAHPPPEQAAEALIAELLTAKLEYLHAAVDALAAVELWLALDAWMPEDEAPAA